MPSFPNHMMLLCGKPRLGSSYIRQTPIFNYRHRKLAVGGDDSASGTLAISMNEAEWWYENTIGNGVMVFVDDPIAPVFDGYISRVTYEIGGEIFTRSVDEMFNRTNMDSYSKAGAALAVTSDVNVAASQSIYMVKEGRIAGEVDYGGTSKAAIRSILSAKYAWPQVSFSQGGGAIALKLEIKGWHHIWEWENYDSANTTVIDADVAVARATVNTLASPESNENGQYIYAVGAGGIGNTWAQFIQVNPGFTISREATNSPTYWDRLTEIVAGGNGSNAPWVIGITRRNAFNATRYVYYKPANTAVEYYRRQSSEPGAVRDRFGRLVQPWRAEPDRSIQVTDVLFGWAQAGQDPRATYIEALEYNSDDQTVTYQGGDDITATGIFGVNQRFKVRGRGVGRVPPRDRL